MMVLLPYGFLLEDNDEYSKLKPRHVLLPYGFLLEDNFDTFYYLLQFVLLPYGFLLEDNAISKIDQDTLSFATIWIFARR